MTFNYSKLRGRIREKFSTQENFAKEMDMAMTSLSFKLNNKVYFSQLEINKACQLLDIKDDEVTAYFFTEEV